MINKTKNSTISEISAEKDLNTLNEIKNTVITKQKRRTPKQKELLNLFNDLSDTILTDKKLESKSQKDDENGNENVDENVNKNENENLNENDETLMSSNEDDENKNEDDDETMHQNKIIKELNDHLDKIIDKSKLFEEQIKSLKKQEDLKGFWPYNDHGDKELKSKYFKIKLADMSNDIDEKLFEAIFGHTLETLANKLINTTNKEENQIIVNNINKNKDKIYEQDDFGDWVIQPSDQRIDLIDAIDLILDFNEETIQLDLV